MNQNLLINNIKDTLSNKEKDKLETSLNSSTPFSALQTFKEEIDNRIWNKDILSRIGYQEMENLITDLYIHKGFISGATQKTRDGGVDVVAEKNNGSSIWIEVKHWSSRPFGINDFREFYGAVRTPEVHINGVPPSERNIKEMHIVSTCGFTKTAEQKASEVQQNESNLQVELIGPSELIYLLNKFDICPDKYLKE